MKHPFAAPVFTLSWLASLYLGAVSTLALACADDGASDEPRVALAGGWSDSDASRYVCFARDGRMWVGDSRAELGGPSHCTADVAAKSFECADPDGGDSFGGSIASRGNELTLNIVPCPPNAECHAVYARDTTVTCAE